MFSEAFQRVIAVCQIQCKSNMICNMVCTQSVQIREKLICIPFVGINQGIEQEKGNGRGANRIMRESLNIAKKFCKFFCIQMNGFIQIAGEIF